MALITISVELYYGKVKPKSSKAKTNLALLCRSKVPLRLNKPKPIKPKAHKAQSLFCPTLP